MENYTDIIYPGSPFSPDPTPANIAAIRQTALRHGRPLSVAVSFEIAEIAIALNQYHAIDLNWLTQTFNTDVQSVDLFMFGYTMAPSLIIGAFIMENFGPKEAFSRICPPATDDFLLSVNVYKSNNLIDCFVIYQDFSFDQLIMANLIYDHCIKEPLNKNKFFLAGILSSKINFTKLFEQSSTN